MIECLLLVGEVDNILGRPINLGGGAWGSATEHTIKFAALWNVHQWLNKLFVIVCARRVSAAEDDLSIVQSGTSTLHRKHFDREYEREKNKKYHGRLMTQKSIAVR